MAGELWLAKWQLGKETTAGVAVPATRIMYGESVQMSRDRESRPHEFATGTRDGVRAHTLGPQVVGGSLSMPLSADEIIEALLLGVKGGVTPTTPGGATNSRLWTFVPGSSALDSATFEWNDGARPWQDAGVRVNSLNIAGSVKTPNMVTLDLFGLKHIQNAMTGSLVDRVPTFIEGWETKLYVDNFGATPGTTNIAGTLLSWDITLNNNLARKFWADNVNAAGGVAVGKLGIDATLVFEAAPSAALTEYNNWDAQTKRLVRVEFGQNDVIETTFKRFVTVDLPGAWSAVNLGADDDGTRAYEFKLQYVYDITNAFGIQYRAQNARTAAW